MKFILNLFIWFLILTLSAQNPSTLPQANTKLTTGEKKWFENISIRGYMQVRYNRLLETNSKLVCEQCDRSWGKGGGFFIRRMRIIFYGQISKNVYFYVQPDFASTPDNSRLNFAQIRDAYFDIGLDPENTFRLRIGQSKVPYGFENMQSSQNRIPLDRNDALNSAVSNERDLGVFFYYAPKKIRDLFSELVKSGLKGSGDYGVFAFGAYNGQTANANERNNTPHLVSRITYPFKIGNQIIEGSLQGFTGKTVIASTSAGVKKGKHNFIDRRVAASFIVYPKPFGFVTEFTVGQGPQFNSTTDSIITKSLYGGYAQAMYMAKIGKHTITPFIRYQTYNGGKKHELDSRSYNIKEFEIGVEWQPYSQFELVVMWTNSNRKYSDFVTQNYAQQGSLLRVQAQVNF